MEADGKLFDIWQQFNFDVDPINSESEKKKFFSNQDYNPQFRYSSKQNFAQFRKNLLSVSPDSDSSWVSKIIKQRRDMILLKIDMLLNRNAESFTSNSITLFGKPDHSLVSIAREDVKLPEEAEIKNLSDKDAASMLSRTLTEMNLNHWSTQIRENMSAAARIDSAGKMVYIRKGELFSFAGVERLIVHELQTHVFRMENSMLQKYKIFQIGFPHYLETEEGLAAYNEEQAEHLHHNKIKKTYAGRVLAVSLALEKEFSDVFAELRKYFSEEDAWRLTLRTKRGLHDTSETGGFTKDYIYLNGKLKVKNFIERNKNDGISEIYRGKVGLDHLEDLRVNKSEVTSPIYLPNYSAISLLKTN